MVGLAVLSSASSLSASLAAAAAAFAALDGVDEDDDVNVVGWLDPSGLLDGVVTDRGVTLSHKLKLKLEVARDGM